MRCLPGFVVFATSGALVYGKPTADDDGTVLLLLETYMASGSGETVFHSLSTPG